MLFAAWFSLAGTADASLKLTPAELSFGAQPVGTTSPPTPVTLTLVCDTLPCTMTDGDSFEPTIAVPPGFAQANDCPFRLIVNMGRPTESCTIRVTFTPVTPGAVGGSLTVGTKDSQQPAAALLGTGTEIAAEPVAASGQRKRCKRRKKPASTSWKRKCKRGKRR